MLERGHRPTYEELSYAVLASAGTARGALEITLTETPRHNWGFRGLPGDEIGLAYKVDV